MLERRHLLPSQSAKGTPVVQVVALRIGKAPGVLVRDDKMSITMGFEDGSVGTVNYFANGPPLRRWGCFSYLGFTK